jgi:uncharacterized protein
VAVLIDTSFLVALTVSADKNHTLARRAIADLRGQRIVAVPVMPESFYMVSVRGNYGTAVKLYHYLQNAAFQIEPLTLEDRLRMGEIMNTYLDAEFDFVELAIMAISERLGIQQICTFDKRDFSIYRPKHTSHFEILPT